MKWYEAIEAAMKGAKVRVTIVAPQVIICVKGRLYYEASGDEFRLSDAYTMCDWEIIKEVKKNPTERIYEHYEEGHLHRNIIVGLNTAANILDEHEEKISELLRRTESLRGYQVPIKNKKE